MCVALFLKVEAGRLLIEFFSLNTSNETYFECLGFPSIDEIFFFGLKLILGKKALFLAKKQGTRYTLRKTPSTYRLGYA